MSKRKPMADAGKTLLNLPAQALYLASAVGVAQTAPTIRATPTAEAT